ncbi:MAG: ABC transporter ATP-binding protein [Synergistaceae bacterium]|nr:ABC transporter ATP-binding protein [Synergistaceae bacterium]
MIRCQGVSVSYDGKAAVEDVSFEVEAGDCVCVVGENGSGKSSLMKCMLGLLKPSAGEISFDGLKRSEIGYLPQQAGIRNDFPASVYEVVLSGCSGRYGPFAFYRKEDKARAVMNIERLGIAPLRRKSYRDLSGGQRQRVLLARALVAADKLLMLDEPVTGLDPMIASDMYAILESERRAGKTVVMISHDLKSAILYGNKILHLRKKAQFFGPSSEYVNSDPYRRLNGASND